MNEAQVGYEAYEDTRTFDTDSTVLEGLSYPCMVVDMSGGINIPKSRLVTLKSMVDNSDMSVLGSAEPVNLYFRVDKLMLIGKLQARQIKSFLKLFDNVQITGYLNAETELVGDNLYILSD